jgi:hypothetical protein
VVAATASFGACACGQPMPDVCGYPHQFRKKQRKHKETGRMGCKFSPKSESCIDVFDASLPTRQRKSQGWRLHPFHEIVGLCALLADLARVPSNMVSVLITMIAFSSYTGDSKLTDSLNAHQHFVRAFMINSLLCLESRSTAGLGPSHREQNS